MSEHQPRSLQPPITCPFCGLGCDDLSLRRGNGLQEVDAHGCPIADERFSRALQAVALEPRVDGEPVPLATALDTVATHLKCSRLPLFAGLKGDLLDMRGALQLADSARGALDLEDGSGLINGLAVLEGSGWITTSLGEARNRADLWLLVGDGLWNRFPRLPERLLFPAQRLHRSQPGKLVLLGEAPQLPRGINADTIRIEPGLICDFIGGVRACLTGSTVSGSSFPEASALAERLAKSRYAVVAFGADGRDSVFSDILIRKLSALVKDLNASGRAALLPLGGADGATSAMQASAWHTGFGPRLAFNTGVPVYQPRTGAAERLLRQGEADLLIWLSTLSDTPPPVTSVPTLVLAHPGIQLNREPAVFIPMAVPGVHRSGAVHRGDGLSLLPLRPVKEATLPDSQEVFAGLIRRLSPVAWPC